jgi:hypothetical protein
VSDAAASSPAEVTITLDGPRRPRLTLAGVPLDEDLIGFGLWWEDGRVPVLELRVRPGCVSAAGGADVVRDAGTSAAATAAQWLGGVDAEQLKATAMGRLSGMDADIAQSILDVLMDAANDDAGSVPR